MLVEWASIFISYVPVSFRLMETESEFAPWDPSKAHILVSTCFRGKAFLQASLQKAGCLKTRMYPHGSNLDCDCKSCRLRTTSTLRQPWEELLPRAQTPWTPCSYLGMQTAIMGLFHLTLQSRCEGGKMRVPTGPKVHGILQT